CQFFFSGRRRHTIFSRDWSSDVCSSDLESLVVASGTGSGKTECFLVPILNSLARALDDQKEPIVGVRALMLYPLNALINSQREQIGPASGRARPQALALHRTPLT